jgi:2-dehydropantoate 2-reductase
MKVIVMGAGGVGGYLSGLLARAGHEVTIIARGPHLEAMQANGLRIETAVEEDFEVPVHAINAPMPGTTADLVLFAVKSYDTEDAMARVRPAVGPSTTVLTLLNGVDSGEKLAASLGPERVLDGAVYIESFIKSPGVIAQVGGPRRVTFGNRNGANGEREAGLFDAFKSAGWEVELSDHMLGALWGKFSYLGPFATFNTVTGLGSAKLCASEGCKELMHDMVSEYVAVGNAGGAKLADGTVDNILERYMSSIVGVTSMLRDRMGGRRLEADSLVGDVARRGEALGVPTPVTSTMYRLLTSMANGGATELGAV